MSIRALIVMLATAVLIIGILASYKD